MITIIESHKRDGVKVTEAVSGEVYSIDNGEAVVGAYMVVTDYNKCKQLVNLVTGEVNQIHRVRQDAAFYLRKAELRITD